MRSSACLLALAILACGDDDAAPRDADALPDMARDVSSDAPMDLGVDGGGADMQTPCALPAAPDEGVAFERTLYVAAGADGTGTEAEPFGTIQDALRAATPGTRVEVAAGTYPRVTSVSPQGEAGRPIKLEARGEVIVDGAGEGVGFAMSDARYVSIEGVTIRNAGVHGMNIDDGGTYDTPSAFVVLRNITIEGAGSGGNNDCIKMSGVDDFWVLESRLSRCDRGESIDMVGCHRGVIRGNRFGETVGSAVQTKGGSSDVLITANTFEDIPGRAVNAGGSTGLEFFRPADATFEAARIRVVANLFLRGGTESGAPIAFVGCDGCAFAHNTVIEPSTWVARILQESNAPRFVPSRNGLFVNNLIVVDPGLLRTTFNVGTGTEPESFVFANNLWYAADLDWPGPSYAGTGIPAGEDELVQRDPRLGGDYTPMADSPAIARARAVSFSLPPDRAGRCFGEPASLGAYEAAN